MRIAVFYHLGFGGAKRVVQEHVKGLVSLGHTVDLYSTEKENDIFDPGRYADSEHIYPFTVSANTIPFLGRVKKDFDIFYRLKKLHEKIALDIDKRKYDIVLVHTDSFTQAPFILRFLKTKKVYFCLEPLRIVYEYSLKTPDSFNFINKLYESYTRMLRKKNDQENARSSDNTLAISLFGREYIILAFDLYPKISYLGVDEKLFHPIKIKKKKQVLFVAEKEKIYGYDLAKKAMELIPKEKRPELKILFGTKKEQRISDAEIVKAYNESILVLSLSRFDTFGLIPLEAMACGVPVIALNVAGYKETVLANKAGFLVDFDPKEIAEKIMFYITHPNTAVHMGKEGRKWVEETWTWKKQIKKLEHYLQNLATNKELSDTD